MRPSAMSDTPAFAHQRGVAALLVTILLALIATVGAIYANRSSNLTQKAANNSYYNVAALQAAETGADAFSKQILEDLNTLSAAAPGTNGEILTKVNPDSGATGCALSGGSLAVPYEFNATYRKGAGTPTDRKQFAAAKFFQNTLSPVSPISGVNQGAGWRVQALIDNTGTLQIRAEGCVSNTGTDTTAGGNICASDDIPRAVVRRGIKLGGAITPSNNAINVRGHYDSNTSFNLSTSTRVVGNPAPQCGIFFGDGGNPGACNENATGPYEKGCLSIGVADNSSGAQIGKKDSTLKSMSADEYFSKFSGGMTRAELKAISTTVTTKAQLDAVPASQQFIWWEGPITAATTFPTGKFIVVNGDVTGSITAQGGSFIYVAGNVTQNGAINVQGAAAVEGVWDRIAGVQYVDGSGNTVTVGDPYYQSAGVTRGPNGMADGLDAVKMHTLAATGTLTVNYERTSFGLPTSAVTTTAGTWIDF